MQLLLGVVIGAATVGALAAMVHTWGHVNDWPAWLQAVGSLLGIAIAIGIPWWLNERQWARSEADRKVKARALALLLMPELLALRTFVAGQKKALSGEDVYDEAFEFHAKRAHFIEQMRLDSGEQFAANVKELYLFGEDLGGDLTQLLAFVAQHNRDVDWIAKTPSIQKFDTVVGALPRIEAIERLLNSCMTRLIQLHDAPTSKWR